MRALAVEILDQCVGGVGFEADAIISVDNVTVRDMDGVAAVNIPSVSVLRLLPARLNGVKADVVKRDVFGPVNQVVPERTLHLIDVLDENVLGVVNDPRDGTSLASLSRCQCVPQPSELSLEALLGLHTLYQASPLPE